MTADDNGFAGSRQRYALAIEYDGSHFSGWQIQSSPSVKTVQGALQAALSEVANQPVKLYCAGRTDAGVHASAQIVHFETTAERPEKAWVRGGNTLLPESIAVLWARKVSDDFHARFSATARRYRYIIYNRPVRPALLSRKLTVHFAPLDVERMQAAAVYFPGERDFSSFRGAACQSSTPMRNIIHLDVQRYGDFIVIDIKANAFLLHMVRNIAGVLMEIGEGRREPQWAQEVLENQDRTTASVTAPPHGLYLVAVDYPEYFGLPVTVAGPDFFRFPE